MAESYLPDEAMPASAIKILESIFSATRISQKNNIDISPEFVRKLCKLRYSREWYTRQWKVLTTEYQKYWNIMLKVISVISSLAFLFSQQSRILNWIRPSPSIPLKQNLPRIPV